jgi:hypothetical protein
LREEKDEERGLPAARALTVDVTGSCTAKLDADFLEEVAVDERKVRVGWGGENTAAKKNEKYFKQ